MRSGFVVLLLQFFVWCPSVFAASSDGRSAVPDAAAQAKAQKLLNEIYGDRLAGAKTPEQKSELASTLLQRGVDTKDSAELRYVAWTTARTQALDAGNAELALAIVKQLVTSYAIDADATTLAALDRLADTAQTPADRRRTFDEAEHLSNLAVTEARLDVAVAASQVEAKIAGAMHDGAEAARADAQAKLVHEVAAANTAAEGAREALAKDPGDPKASLDVGSFLCFMQDDWAAGLPLLASGSDPAIASVAKADLASPLLGDAQAAVADRWWELSQKMTGVAQLRVRARAAKWYKAAEPNLEGIARDHAREHLAEIAGGSGQDAIATTGPSSITESVPPPSVPESDPLLEKIRLLQDRGWYAQAAAVARAALADPRTTSKLRGVLRLRAGKLLVLHAQARLGFGVVALSRDAIQQVTTADYARVDPAELTPLRTSLRALPTGGPVSLSEADPLKGDVIWNAQPKGYVIESAIQVGNSDRNHGGSWLAGKLQIQSGVYIHGGTLRVSGGSITFKGSASKPVFLDGVRVECEYTGAINAENTVFQNCVFTKAGGYHWNGGYSAKWTFVDCLFQNSSFTSLARMDYGIKIGRCTFSECKLPGRDWGYMKTESATEDGAKRTRQTWSQIIDCDFYDCSISPSALWLADGSNFYGCEVAGSAEFLSNTDLQSQLGLPASDKGFLQELTDKTTAGGSGRVIYSAVKPFTRVRASPFWKLLEKSATS